MTATGDAAYILANYQVVVDVAQRDRYSYEPFAATVLDREENGWAGLFALLTDVVSVEDDDAKFPYMAPQAAAGTIGRGLEGMGTQMRYGGSRLPAIVTEDGSLGFVLPGTAAWHDRYGRMCAGSTSSSSPVVVKLPDRAPADGSPRDVVLAANHSDFGAYHAVRYAVVPRGRAGCKPLTRWDFTTIRPSEMGIYAWIISFLINIIKSTRGGDVKVKECEFTTMLAHAEHRLTFGPLPRSHAPSQSLKRIFQLDNLEDIVKLSFPKMEKANGFAACLRRFLPPIIKPALSGLVDLGQIRHYIGISKHVGKRYGQHKIAAKSPGVNAQHPLPTLPSPSSFSSSSSTRTLRWFSRRPLQTAPSKPLAIRRSAIWPGLPHRPRGHARNLGSQLCGRCGTVRPSPTPLVRRLPSSPQHDKASQDYSQDYPVLPEKVLDSLVPSV